MCPESKVTPAMSRDKALNMPITAVFVDEVQVPLEDRTPVQVEGKKLTAGEYVGELLTWLAKKGPAAGIVLVLATQRPDSKTIPSGLRAVLGSRFALRVMDWRDSNIVLGEQMNTRGYDSSRLLASHKGVGILRPDGDTQAGADVLALTVRTYYMPNEDWHELCHRGRALREAAGTLTGHAAGRDSAPELDHAAVVQVIGAGRPAEERRTLPEPLASVVAYLGTTGRPRVRPDRRTRRGTRRRTELVRPRHGRPRLPVDTGPDHRGGRVARRVRGYRTADIRAAMGGEEL